MPRIRPTFGSTLSVAKQVKENQLFSGGRLSDVLDLISIPQYAATGLLSKRKTVGEAVKGRFTPSQALNIKSPVGRFAADVLLDPLNLAFGAGLAGKGLKVSGKVLKSAGLARAGARAAKFAAKGEPVVRAAKFAARPVVREVGRAPTVAKIVGGAKKAIGLLPEQVRFTEEAGKLKLGFSEARAGVKQRSKLVQALDKLTEEELKSVVPVLQKRASVFQPSKQFTKALKQWKKWAEKEAKAGLSRGDLIPRQVEERVWKPLMKVTGKSLDELKELGFKTPTYVPGIVEDRVKMSEFFLPQPLRKIKPGFLKKFAGKSVGIEADPRVLVERRQIAGIRHRMTTDFIDKIENMFGTPIKKGQAVLKDGRKIKSVFEEGVQKWNVDGVRYREFKPEGALRFFRTEVKEGKELVGVSKRVKSFLVPETVYHEMNRFMGSRSGLEKLLSPVLDPTTDLFRISVLGLNPAWVANNFAGNLVVNTMSGVMPWDYLRMFGKQKIPKAVKGGLFKAEQHATALKRVIHQLDEVGRAGELAALPLKTVVKLSKPMFKLNSKIEDIFRNANYLSGRAKGLSNKEAIKNVNKWLFDYSKLTNVERRYFRKLFPFWSWTRNINGLAARVAVEEPHIVNFIKQARPFVEDLKAEGHIAETGDIKLPSMFSRALGTEKQLYLATKGPNPFTNVGNVLTVEGYLSSLGPAYKVAMERALRLKFFGMTRFTSPYREIEDGKVMESLPPLWRHIASISPQFRTVDDLLRPYVKYNTGQIKLKKGARAIRKPRRITAVAAVGPRLRVQEQIEAELRATGKLKSTAVKREEARRKTFEQRSRLFAARAALAR
jgi:hypothetical protein